MSTTNSNDATRNEDFKRDMALVGRVAVISTYADTGGAARAAIRHHQALCQSGIDSTMVTMQTDPPDDGTHALAQSDYPRGSELALLRDSINRSTIQNNRSGITSTHYSWPLHGVDLTQIQAVQDADTLSIHWVSKMMTIEMLERLAAMGKRIVLTLHDEWMFTGGCHYTFGCDGFVSNCAQCPQLISDPFGIPAIVLDRRASACNQIQGSVVTPSQWLGESSSRSRVLGSWNHAVIPYAIDTNLFAPAPQKQALERFQLDPARSWALMITSDQDERKGGDVLVQAIQHALRTSPSIRDSLGIILVGQCQSHQQELETLGIMVHSCTPSDDTELAALYAACNSMVLPTLADNLPNTMLESLACGRPVIGSDIGGVPDFVINNTTGNLSPVADTKSLSNHLIRLAENPELYAQMEDACRKQIEQRCDPLVHAQSWATVAAATPPCSQIQIGDDTPLQNGVLRMLTDCAQVEREITQHDPEKQPAEAIQSTQLKKAISQRDQLARRLQAAQNTVSRKHSLNLESINALAQSIKKSRSLAHLQHEAIGQRIEQSRTHIETQFAEHLEKLTESINAQRDALQKYRRSQIDIDKLNAELAHLQNEMHKARTFNATLIKDRDDATAQLNAARSSHAAARDKYEAERIKVETLESKIKEVRDDVTAQLNAARSSHATTRDKYEAEQIKVETLESQIKETQDDANSQLQALQAKLAQSESELLSLNSNLSQSLTNRIGMSCVWILKGKLPASPQSPILPSNTPDNNAPKASEKDENG